MSTSRAICVGVLLPISALPALASSFSFSGAFSQDDQQFAASFMLLTSQTVTLQTWSYAGGTDPVQGLIAAGGFAPVLSLFDSTGTLLGFDDGGVAPSTCGARNIDPVSGYCLDAFMQNSLPAGSYSVVLTEYDNTPNGATLADGFSQDGNGNFTGTEHGIPGGSFLDPGLNQRTANFDFSITGADSASASGVPEPAPALYLGSGMVLWSGLSAMRSRIYKSRKGD
jgi:hypothetical protein